MGSPSELEEFCRNQYPALVRILGLYCGSVEVAEELAQEALARVWRHWNKVRKLDHPPAWALRVALNLARSHFRRRAAEKRATARLQSQRLEAHVPPPASESEVIREAVARLPGRHKTALILRYYLDLSFPEVAEWMGVPEGTAKSLAHRAIARLREDQTLIDLKEVPNVT